MQSAGIARTGTMPSRPSGPTALTSVPGLRALLTAALEPPLPSRCRLFTRLPCRGAVVCSGSAGQNRAPALVALREWGLVSGWRVLSKGQSALVLAGLTLLGFG